jgi:CDP-diacylglycerol--glycerol-3-phosphate 3-phosphatidyltransferase
MAQLGKRASVSVNSIAKLKTGVQMTAIPILLWYPSEPAGEELKLLGLVLLAAAVLLTLWSMVIYFRAFLATLEEQDAVGPGS